MGSLSHLLDGDIVTENLPEPPDAGVDVVIRYHSPARSLELDRALMSVFHQTYAPVRVILVTQGFSESETAEVTRAVNAYDWTARHAAPVVLSVENSPGVDARSRLLNAGLGALKLRYVAFLDFDDYLYSYAYEHLTQISQADDAALAFARVVVMHIRVFEKSIYNVTKVLDPFVGYNIEDFLSGNFCPIHSFVIDRRKVENSQLHFDERLSRLEDYDFLLRLAAQHKFSFGGLNKKIGVYNYRLDGSNSVQVFDIDEEKAANNTRQWNEARRHIWRLKTKVRDKILKCNQAPCD